MSQVNVWGRQNSILRIIERFQQRTCCGQAVDVQSFKEELKHV